MYAAAHSRTDAAVKVFLARKAKKEAEEKKREKELRLQRDLEISRVQKEIIARECYRELSDRIAALESALSVERQMAEAARNLLEQARQEILELRGAGGAGALLPIDIIKDVAREYGVTVYEILSHSRLVHLVGARDAAIRRVADMRHDLSCNAIGRIFKRDHSSIYHSLGKTKKPGDRR